MEHIGEVFPVTCQKDYMMVRFYDDLDIAEMVCDWCAMGVEKGNKAKTWADNNVGVRWGFTDVQKDLIYELIDVLEN